MCDTQRKIIKTFTQESLDKCTEIMMSNFEKMKKDLLDKLGDGIRLDIFDKINGLDTSNNIDYKMYDMEDIKKECIQKFPTINNLDQRIKILLSNGIEKIKELRILKQNEHYIHFINHYRSVRKISGCVREYNSSDVIILLGTITNFSNFTWLEIKGSLQYFSHQDTVTTEYKFYDLNTPLHCMYINILTTIKSLSPQSHGCGCYTYGGPHDYTYVHVVNTHEMRSLHNGHCNNYLDNNKIFYGEIYDIIVKILDMNKKYFVNMLVELDLQKKYDKLLNEKEHLNTTNMLLNEKIIRLEKQLKDSIPEEHRCCICFGYTDKKKVCVPCGHAQYCSKCVDELSECALCRKTITSVIKLFNT